MAVKWTDEQQEVIDVRGCNVLVSAAAGSGKTAVLVARILSMITDEKKPVDIDRLLVVTFTNAAAAEMRERIRDALEKRAEEEPENVHLQRQLVLVHNAKITTIHSFCLNVLRNHFQLIGIDPSFRVADEGEMILLEEECVRETVSEAYEDADEEFREVFREFLEGFAPGKSDRIVEETVLSLYHYALGQPWPKAWLAECCRMYPDSGRAENGRAENSREETGRQPDCTQDGAAAAGKEHGTCRETAGFGAENAPWMQYIIEDTAKILDDLAGQVREAVRICEEPDGPYPYRKALQADLKMLERLRAAGPSLYENYAQAFRNIPAYTALGRKKDDSISEEKKLLVQALRAEMKEGLAALRQRYYYDKPEVLRQEFADSGKSVRVLVKLTEDFMERLAQKKSEKNILDFGDLEHFALQALAEPAGGGFVPTAAAAEYAEMFEEIMIDEYQDSNLVQEMILTSVSGRGSGEQNRFMVGDVKQSIYRFRLARPELFMGKYKEYRNTKDKTSCRIDLHRNFRSRSQVLDGVNYIFRQIMTENLGGIVYDKDAALYPGSTFPEREQGTEFLKTEFLLLEADTQTKQQEEAGLVGRRIQEIAGKEMVLDKETGEYRPARYGDIVILLRTVSGWAETFAETLGDMGIPCFTGTQKGYFSAAEVRTVLAYLQILDNPVQDIPLAAVLRSAIGKISDEELAKIRSRKLSQSYDTETGLPDRENEIRDMVASFQKREKEIRDREAVLQNGGYGMQNTDNPQEDCRDAGEQKPYVGASFYDYVQEYRRYGEDESLRGKLDRFFSVYEKLRAKCGHTPVHLLIWELLEVTGYGAYAEALPAGIRRKANLDMLVEKAIAYEATSYRGLYHFVRYIENLKKYEVDYGEANTGAETADTVRIMSIHKSKGLEFPIVFVSGLGKQFNESDIRSKAVMHPEFGIACDCVDTKLRTRQPSLLKKTIQQKTSAENLGEELRVLYVAMTRAKEKLILTGSVADAADKIGKWSTAARYGGAELSYSWLCGASTYLDWVAPALLRHPDAYDLFIEADVDGSEVMRPAAPLFSMHLVTADEMQQQERTQHSDEAVRLSQLLNLPLQKCFDAGTHDYLQQVFAAVYPYENDREIVGKLSVSELKKLSHMPEEEDARELYRPETVIPLVPDFLGDKEALSGAARGTAYHNFMENLDYSKKDGLEIQLEELISCGKMSKEEGEALRLDDIRRFLATPSGRRMERAALSGQLFRERPFVLGLPADRIRSGWNPQETVLVQGIIDAYFIEDGQISVLDYKTDRVGHPQELAEKYRAQLDYYALALERLTGYKVKDRILYSFHLGEDIIL